MPGFLKNRIRTITGTHSGFFTSVKAILSYSLYQLIYGQLIFKAIRKFFVKQTDYSSWLKSRMVDGNYSGKLIRVLNQLSKEVPAEGYVLISNEGDTWRQDAKVLLERFIVSNHFPEVVTFNYDLIDENGLHTRPHFNPIWSPHTLAARNYLQNAFCIKAELLNHTLPSSPQSQYELLLNWIQEKKTIVHYPEIFLHKRQLVSLSNGLILHNLSADRVSIIIPTRNNAIMVKQCIDSILQHTTYINYEIVLVDNHSTEESLEKLIEHYRNKLQSAFIHVKADFSFNFSKLINLGAAHATGNYYILLNNDTSVITADWIERMLAKFSIPKTGAVGAKLLYPDNSIQHAGIVLQENTISRHINLGEKPDNELVSYNRNYLALTAACMMVSREAFNHVKGFDQSLAVNYNDIDFCIRLYKDSYHNVYAADVCLYHFESASRQHPFANWRSGKNFRIESAIMREKWFSLIADDPYYSKYQSMFTS